LWKAVHDSREVTGNVRVHIHLLAPYNGSHVSLSEELQPQT